ncbi:MAG: hypothetical protein IPM33_05015 [Phycisphaerales bacterium]|nr:hypothetical protein [Phycisphaerales bacterium]
MRVRFSTILVPLCAVSLFAALAITMRQDQQAAIASAIDQGTLDRPPRPIAEVAAAVRAMKLITVEIDTKVKVARTHESWRGDVAASIEVPVRLHYGTDLAALADDGVTFLTHPSPGVYRVRIPRAKRIATEVFSGLESIAVQTGWLRLRSRAGEYYLGVARKEAADEARELQLRPEDAQRVADVTCEQVARLVGSIVGPGPAIEVEFAPEP